MLTVDCSSASLILTPSEKQRYFSQISSDLPAGVSSLCAQIKLAAGLGEKDWVNEVAAKLVGLYRSGHYSDVEKTDILISLIVGGRPDLFSELVCEKYTISFGVDVLFGHYAGPVDSLCFCVDSPDSCRLVFHCGILELPWREIALVRAYFLLRLFFSYMQAGGIPERRYVFQLGDLSGDNVCGFCSNAMNPILIPDASFFQSHGYIYNRDYFSNKSFPWSSRKPVVLWRGQTTGDAINWTDLDRVKLCLAARRSRYAAHMDIALTGIVQRTEAEADQIRAAGLLSEFVPSNIFDEYKYNIDIDGNTNSWPGLFIKLLSGSPVLKVESRLKYKQWYYDRLIPWHNFVPIKSDFSDFDEAVGRLMENEIEAEEIGRRGACLAYEMTLDREVNSAIRLMEKI